MATQKHTADESKLIPDGIKPHNIQGQAPLLLDYGVSHCTVMAIHCFKNHTIFFLISPRL